MQKFTHELIDKIKPKPNRIEISDSVEKGLRLRIHPTGTKSFVWYYKEEGITKVATLGRYGTTPNCMSVKQARKKLRQLKNKHQKFLVERFKGVKVMNTHGLRIEFGKHNGELWTRVPVSYLRWIVNSMDNPDVQAIAYAEIKRRGSTIPKVELSGHAIDNASLRVLEQWQATRRKREGLYSWLERMTLEAISKGEKLDTGKIRYLRMKFVIEQGDEFPVLKTIM